MKKRNDLPQTLLYESMYAPVQTHKKDKEELLKIDYVEKEHKKLKQELQEYPGRFLRVLTLLWRSVAANFAEEWIFLAFLGILVALISYMIDRAVLMCNSARVWLYQDLAEHPWARYFGWISLPVCLCMFSAGFVKIVAPNAAGSGIPEVKTIMRGVYIENVLTFRVLIAKIVGLTSTLGSSMPLGKEGPLIHISSCLVTQLGKMVSFQGIYQNESRKVEMLAAACAVGVACCFGAPIGGVLLSVEITTAYFSVRNYWRGFCAAVWGATVYRLLLVWIEGVETVTVLFKTSFFVDTPFAAQELFAFAILGVICGLGGAFYMRLHIKYSRFLRDCKRLNAIRKANFFIYPGGIALIVASASYPLGIGKFMAGHIPYGTQVTNLFSNFTWTGDNLTVVQNDIVKNWQTKHTGIYLHLICFIGFNVVCSILSSTIPIPSGTFSPTFRAGAAVGRILGELMHSWYPTGLSYHGRVTKIIPGGYSIVGAAAFTGAVTQTMSVAVIILEMTSQITHVIPILIAVLIANGIAHSMGPSAYNSGIKAKKLPYLPDLLPNNSDYCTVYVEDFMCKNLKFIYNGMTFDELKTLLMNNKKVGGFPLVDSPDKMVLLGSIQRPQLVKLIQERVGKQRRLESFQQLQRSQSQPGEGDAKSEVQFTDNPVYKVPRSPSRVCDLSPLLQKRWEQSRLAATVDFSTCHVDPAPFQLVERTSLLKVHTLFSMVGVNSAYVTSVGKLVGMVGLSDLTAAIDDVNAGKLRS